jgi:3-deoxy-D-manno-octulosonic-acid transferase
MLAYYAAADVAFVGGSLAPLGGQNLIEALAAGAPVLIGPHTFNFSEAAAGAVAAGAAQRVADADALVHTVSELFTDSSRRDAMREAAGAFHAAHRGATRRLVEWIAPQLDDAIRRRDGALNRSDHG